MKILFLLIKSIYSPDKFKIKGNIDYWGKWKINHPDINALSAHERDNFVKAGVYKQYSSPEETISFFNWLHQQPNETISDHIKQIINHWKKDRRMVQYTCTSCTKS